MSIFILIAFLNKIVRNPVCYDIHKYDSMLLELQFHIDSSTIFVFVLNKLEHQRNLNSTLSNEYNGPKYRYRFSLFHRVVEINRNDCGWKIMNNNIIESIVYFNIDLIKSIIIYFDYYMKFNVLLCYLNIFQ